MDRPCFLIVDNEYPGSISARKLVIETAKFNVITAYDAGEAVACLKRFPKVDGVVIDAAIGTDEECKFLIRRLREIVPDIDVVITSTRGYRQCDREYHVDSLEPQQLLDCLQKMRREAAEEIKAHEADLSREEES